MKPYEKTRIVFDGPPSHESGRFIEVENEHGEGMSLGEWKQEGEFWYLEFPNPAKLEAENETLREYATHKKDCFQAKSVFRIIRCSCGLDALLAGKETP